MTRHRAGGHREHGHEDARVVCAEGADAGWWGDGSVHEAGKGAGDAGVQSGADASAEGVSMVHIHDMDLTPYSGWLDRLGTWLTQRTMRRAIRRGENFGEYIIVPEGYMAVSVHRKPSPGTSDPLQQQETIGWKLMKG